MNAYELADGGEHIAQTNYSLDNQIRGYLNGYGNYASPTSRPHSGVEKEKGLSRNSPNPMNQACLTGKDNYTPVAWMYQDNVTDEWEFSSMKVAGKCEPLYTTPLPTRQTKPLSDEEMNKAFDYYCETDEGVLRFNYELRNEWKKEQLIRWKEAFRKAWD